MKRTLTFIPLGIGISAAIIYVFNIISYRIINDSVAMSQILSNLKIYLYISIIGFVIYFILKVLLYMSENKKPVVVQKTTAKKEVVTETKTPKIVIEDDEAYEPIEFNIREAEKKDDDKIVVTSNNESLKTETKAEEKEVTYVKEEKIYDDDKFCPNCGQRLHNHDRYCTNCGKHQYFKKKNTLLRNIINVLEIVIMILVIYFLVNMLFDYKEKIDPKFESPFKVSMTK